MATAVRPLTRVQRCAAFVEPDGATEWLLMSSVGGGRESRSHK